MSFIQILDQQSADTLRTFEKKILENTIVDEMEREMATWNAPWRAESLQLYLSTGWSVGLWSSSEKTEFLGYFLAQPLLFFSGLTQVLWIESLSAKSEAAAELLIDTAIRYSKEKHLQSVLFNSSAEFEHLFSKYKGEKFASRLYEVKTTKR